MPTVRLDLEYDGTDFRGWQVQPGARTVQGCLEEALGDILGQAVRLTGAGRTDAGVHALGQVASFRHEPLPPAPQLLRRLNIGTPGDIRVTALQFVEDDFSARHSARARRYRYQMLRQRSALWTRYHHELRAPVDVERMHEAAQQFLGEQDFSAFAHVDPEANNRCLVSRAVVHGDASRVWFEITANRFLHNMVRRLAGILVEVGRGRLQTPDVVDILRHRDHSRGGPCLPARGLFFVAVDYGRVAMQPGRTAVDLAPVKP
jgi:tRNA pseudouridine38-40 synthase